jgi:hypothetical protein
MKFGFKGLISFNFLFLWMIFDIGCLFFPTPVHMLFASYYVLSLMLGCLGC